MAAFIWLACCCCWRRAADADWVLLRVWLSYVLGCEGWVCPWAVLKTLWGLFLLVRRIWEGLTWSLEVLFCWLADWYWMLLWWAGRLCGAWWLLEDCWRTAVGWAPWARRACWDCGFVEGCSGSRPWTSAEPASWC